MRHDDQKLRFVHDMCRNRKGLSLDDVAPALSVADAAAMLDDMGACPTPPPLFEYMQGKSVNGGRSKLYLDSDQYLDAVPSASEMGRHDATIRAAVKDFLRRVAARARKDLVGVGELNLTYRMATRHGHVPADKKSYKKNYKLSYRIFVQGLAMAEYYTIKKLLQELYPTTDSIMPWDLSVYKEADQLMGSIYAIKSETDTRRLMPCFEEDDGHVLEYTALWTHPDWPVWHYSPSALPPPHAITPAAVQSSSSSADMERLLRMLKPERWDNRDTWIRIALALKNDYGPEEYYALWLHLSRACSSKYCGVGDSTWEADARKTWVSLGSSSASSGSSKITMATIRRWAKEDTPEAYAAALEADSPALMNHDAPSAPELEQVNKPAIVQALSRVPGVAPPPSMEASSIRLQPKDGALRIVADGYEGCEISPDLIAKTTCGKFAGTLYDELTVPSSLCYVNKNIPETAQWKFARGAEHGTLRYLDFTIAYKNMDKAKVRTMTVSARGIQSAAVKREYVGEAALAIQQAIENYGRKEFRLTPQLFLTVNNVTVNNLHASEDDDIRADSLIADAWSAYQNTMMASSPEARAWRLVHTGDVFYKYEAKLGTWRMPSGYDYAIAHMTRGMEALGFMETLNEKERKYVRGRGGNAVLRRTLPDIYDGEFVRRLDGNVDLLPFKNGAYNLKTGEFRALAPDDYVTTTLDYEYYPPSEVPAEDAALVTKFFEQVLPDPEERELFLRMAGSALLGMPVNKKFIVLQDWRGGDNGKSMVIKAMMAAFGVYCMSSQPAFLMASSHVNANGHEANTLSYQGKRLGVFDETSGKMKFDLAKLKSLTGGAPRLAARGAGAANVTEFRWTAFIMIACNKNCLPEIDSTDTAFINRMVTIPMRAKFNDAEAAAGTPHSHPVDSEMEDKLYKARLAIMHCLLEALARHQQAGGKFGELPPGCLELRNAVVRDSDPNLDIVSTYVDENIEFNLTRGEDQKGKRVLGYVKRDDIVDGVRPLLRGKGLKVAEIKSLVDTVMAAHGRVIKARTTIDDVQVCNVFIGCIHKMFVLHDD